MVKKVARFQTLDGKEFLNHEEAYTHEKGLKLIQDVKGVIDDVISSTVDPKGRQVYNAATVQTATLADLLVTTDLAARLKPLLKDLGQ